MGRGKDALRIWVQCSSYRAGFEGEKNVAMQLAECKVRIRASNRFCKTRPLLCRLDSREAALSGTHAHEQKLVVFAALQLE
jgi:isoleucyl-tRNA synthetase